MKKNDIFELEITGMTHEGLGVGKKDGLAVFVQGAIDGELVRIKVIKIAKNYAVARVENWLRKSPHRQEPFCLAYKRCGGCSLQHMTYEKQLEFKHRVVKDNLERIGGFKDIQVNPVIGMEIPMYYRNKAQYPVGMGERGVIAGFYARRSHEIITSDNCGIQDTKSEAIRNAIIKKVKEFGISPYDENTGKGLLRHIITRVAHSTGDIMVVLVVTSEKIPHLDQLVKHILERNPQVKSIVLNINSRRDNVILGDKVITVYGEDTLIDTLGPFQFHISPLSFYQVNLVQTAVLYEKAVEYAALTGNETVYDLYCGIGTISLFLARQAKQVIGVEVVEEGVQAARKNAKLNRIDNTEFHAGLAEEVVPRLYLVGKKADVVVVDPPRKGCDLALLETMVRMQPERIVYVSCNPSTLARDLKVLCGYEYSITAVQPVDMFPWTEHVEAIILMTRSGSSEKK
ncbi:MAG: 23S rRNA (uracil(1939)-C(5))-methyltransferase RlmD [Ruminiclostridium sp.]|nr:23S rRNA (uracil(1939)-C(5))-methyltransferase RlmD [Ruminiclostridium sp.]